MPDMTQEQKDELPKNVITRALGMQDTVVVDLVPEQPKHGDYYVLCSDGLSGMVGDDAIKKAVDDNPSVEESAKKLVDLANAAGGEDNITVVVVKVEGAEGDDGEAEDTAPSGSDEEEHTSD